MAADLADSRTQKKLQKVANIFRVPTVSLCDGDPCCGRQLLIQGSVNSQISQVLRIMMSTRLMSECVQSDTGRCPLHQIDGATPFAAQPVRTHIRLQLAVNSGSRQLLSEKPLYSLRT